MDHASHIRVLIVDDHEILRMGLALFLENHDDFMLVGEASNGKQAIELCDQLQPDVVLMDIMMPVMDGITATHIISQQHPEIAIVMLTSSFTGGREKEAREAGARGYMRKNVTGEKIAETIRAAVHRSS
jgi:two-component system, NarL family, response regulator LiaR